MTYIVSLKPAEGAGPVLVSDDPSVVAAVLDAIHRRYLPLPEPRQGVVAARIVPPAKEDGHGAA
jgi:hypothetical protein